jgi:hypothetical protein
MNNAQQLQEAGKNYHTLFICYLVIVLTGLIGWIPYVSILTGIADVVLMIIIFLTLRKLVSFSQDPAWLLNSGMARTLALLNLLAYPIFLIIALAGAASIVPQLMEQAQQARQAQMAGGPMPDVQIPQSLYVLSAVGFVFGLAFSIISIIFLYKLFKMSALVGELINVKNLTEKANHVKKCYTIILLSFVAVPVLAILLAIIIPNIAGGGQAIAGLFVILFILMFLGLLAFGIYVIVMFLIMLSSTSSELLIAARKTPSSWTTEA